ncbi:MAG: shikimate kinase [Deltaproteobacteria bacterium]|nr:shikimate kinase [Deltaproteobacteria bacterium]
MPGSGKSTIGMLVAQYARLGFLDTDLLLEIQEGRSLQQIVDQDGYLGMRAAEERLILSLACRNQVIATGGSVVYSQPAMQHLKSLGRIVFLDLPLEELLPRLTDLETRGLVRRPGQSLADLYNERLPLYRRYADRTIHCQGLSPEQAARAVLKCLQGD